MGYRLEGERITRTQQELKSEGTCPGTIQITNEGLPIVLMQDCQAIGGYPKLAHVIQADLPRLAQRPAHTRVRFVEVSHDEAIQKRRDLTSASKQFSQSLKQCDPNER